MIIMEKKTMFTLLLVAFLLGTAASYAITESFDSIDMMGYNLLNATYIQGDYFNITGSGSIGGNSTCMWLSSPDGGTTLEVCN